MNRDPDRPDSTTPEPPSVVDRIEREVRTQLDAEERERERSRVWETGSDPDGSEKKAAADSTGPLSTRDQPSAAPKRTNSKTFPSGESPKGPSSSETRSQTAYSPSPNQGSIRRTVVSRPGIRSLDVTIRRFDPYSVLKFSVVFYFSVMLILTFAAMLLFFAADAAGYVENLEKFVQGVGWPNWQIRPVQLFRVLLLVGLVNVICWSAVNVVIAFLYNLVADVIGGITATTLERDL